MQTIVARTYRGLRDMGDSDRDANFSAVRVLELRHPGHDRQHYFFRVAQWLGSERWSYPDGQTRRLTGYALIGVRPWTTKPEI